MAKIKICLDAGHYGKYYNQSPAVKTYYESVMNWNLHLKLKAELEKYGIEVITTRKELDKDLALVERGKKAKGCDLFLSIHSNAAANNVVKDDIDYPVVYVPINGSGDALGKKLADCIASVMGTKQPGRYNSRKGSGDWDYYGVISGSVYVGVPGLILEHSFHTNTRSTKWLMEDSNLDKLAKAEAEVIASHYGLKKTEQSAANDDVWHLVSLGAYSDPKNAEKMLAKAKAAGFADAYITTKPKNVTTVPKVETEQPAEKRKTVAELAKEVIDGKWGNGETRKKKLTDAGYDYTAVQNEVNRILSK